MALEISLLLISFVFSLVTAELVLEEGYVVTTVIDGHKLRINPHTAHARSGSFDMIILDSKASTFFSASLPLSEESVVKRLAGDGVAGYHDGELGQAQFNMPRSFAVDAKGNVYVADKNNKAIRKISHSGTVTTIAGGISKEIGRRDGAAQNATFSNDFELTFIPQGCYLLVSDHGNQLIRQIDLKEEDCARTSHSALGTVSVWAIGLLVSCLLGIVFGLAVRPYVIPNTGRMESPLIPGDMEADKPLIRHRYVRKATAGPNDEFELGILGCAEIEGQNREIAAAELEGIDPATG